MNIRGLSNVVGYVLLVAISLLLSVLVYGWLMIVVDWGDTEKCPEGVGLILDSYNCKGASGGDGGYINVSLKNKGRFNIDGYKLRVHDRSDAEFGLYSLDDVGVPIAYGETYNNVYYFKDYDTFFYDKVLEGVTVVEVQPLMNNTGSCKSLVSQNIVCDV